VNSKKLNPSNSGQEDFPVAGAKMGKTRTFPVLISAVLPIVILLALTGCGVKKKMPIEDAVGFDPGRHRIASWHELMREKREVPEMQKLKSVNSFFNRLEFVEDLIHWGRADYWASPQEMLASNGGDCEDFATAKYFTLRQLNISDEKMCLIHVKSLKLNQSHMVLGYYAEPGMDPLVLDNFTDSILPASERTDLLPIYSFNGQGFWLNRKRGSQRLGGPERLSLWQELRSRFNREVIAAPLP